jgi:hypothetical protein
MTENGKRGGLRPNAGRRATVELFSKRLRLSAIHVAIAEHLGEGNQTEGVRKALDFASEHEELLRKWEQHTDKDDRQ